MADKELENGTRLYSRRWRAKQAGLYKTELIRI